MALLTTYFGQKGFFPFVKAFQFLKNGYGSWQPGAVKPPIDYSFDNALPLYGDNAAGTTPIAALVLVNASNITQLANPNGVEAKALYTVQSATPATPTATVKGTAGATANSYKVVGVTGFGPVLGNTAVSAAVSTTTSNATLTAANGTLLTITLPSTHSPASYDIYRTASGGTPSTTGKIGNVVVTRNADGLAQNSVTISGVTLISTAGTLYFYDSGLAGDSTTPPTVNTTGAVSFPVQSGGIVVPQLATPATPTLVVGGTAGSTTISYKISALDALGKESIASAAGTTTTANATLSTTNKVTVSWLPVPGAVSYNVYRTAAGGTPSTTGVVANVLASAALTYADTGGAGDSTTAPTVNGTGGIKIAWIYDESGLANIKIVTTASAVNYWKSTDSATGVGPSLIAEGSDTNIPAALAGKGTGATVLGQATGVVRMFSGPNYIATESGSNNAIAGALLDSVGVAITLAAGLQVSILLSHSLQAGANSFVLNGTSKSIKSHRNPATDIAVAYVSGGIFQAAYDGTVWQDLSQ